MILIKVLMEFQTFRRIDRDFTNMSHHHHMSSHTTISFISHCNNKNTTNHATSNKHIMFFRAIQSFNDASPKNEEELIQLVKEAYKNYLQHKLNRTWLTLQSCFNQIILHHGDNNYSIEHISKAKLEWQGQLRVFWIPQAPLNVLVNACWDGCHQLDKQQICRGSCWMKSPGVCG